jgi:hypothetical protein
MIHCLFLTKKANNTTGAAFLSSCPADVKSRCYKTLVRPQLEYVATVWDPWTQTSVKSKRYNEERHASHSVTIEEQAVYPIWLFHESVLSMVTPRYFALLVSCNTWPWMVYLASMIFFLFVILMTSHLSGLNDINQSFSHCCKVSRLFCNDTASESVVTPCHGLKVSWQTETSR